MTDFDKFVDALMNEEAPIATKASAPREQFPCQQCQGTGRYEGTRVHQKKDHCFACGGKGYFLTDENTRRKARVQRKTAAAKKSKALIDTFHEENPGLYSFLSGASSWSDFAASLATQVATKGYLSPKQLVRANAMRDKSEAKPTETVVVDLTAIREMFETAVENGHKRPVYRAEGLKINRAPDHGNNPGALYVKFDGQYQGKIVGTEFTGVRNLSSHVLPALETIAKDPLESAIAYGRKTGACACCGRELTNAESIERGIGPICAEKWGFRPPLVL